MGWQDELYKPADKNGPATLLGRTAGSWAKVLAFYAVYYTFLFCLFYAFTIYWYQGNMPLAGQGKTPKITTRVDQPGVGIYPLKNLGEWKVQARPMDLTLKKGSSSKSGEYCSTEDYLTSLNAYFAGKTGTAQCDGSAKDADGNQLSCKTTVPPKNVVLKEKLDNQQPFIALQVNKLINWTPVNVENFPAGTQNPQKNAIYFQCQQWAPKLGVAAVDQAFEFEFHSGRQYIEPKFFPFLGKESESEKTANGMIKTDYNSEWVGFYVKKTDGKWGSDEYSFRCEVFADNIDRPSETKEYSARQDLVKLQVGVVDFGLKWQ